MVQSDTCRKVCTRHRAVKHLCGHAKGLFLVNLVSLLHKRFSFKSCLSKEKAFFFFFFFIPPTPTPDPPPNTCLRANVLGFSLPRMREGTGQCAPLDAGS